MNLKTDIPELIKALSGLEKETALDEALEKALAEPDSAEEQIQQVARVLEAVEEFAESGEDPTRDLHLYQNLARTYERFSHLEKAYATYEKALEAARKAGDRSAEALLHCRLGRVRVRQRMWVEGLSCFDTGERIYKDLGDEHGLARVAVNRGIVLQEQGEYGAAAAVYEDAIARAEAAGDQTIVANARNNLAVLATIRGDYDNAVTQYETCLSMYRDSRDETGMARTYHNLGMTHADREDWKSAMVSYERGYEIAQRCGHLDTVANIQLSRAELLMDLGDTTLATPCCSRALDIYLKTGDRLGEADAYRLLGRAFTVREEYSTAGSLLRDSLRMNEELENPLGVAETRREMGTLFAARGQRSQAREAFEQALNGFRELGSRADAERIEGLIQEVS